MTTSASPAPRPRVVHVTTVHRVGDPRIHRKECASLAAAGWDVRLVASDRSDAPASPGVQVTRLRTPASRLWRAVRGAHAAIQVATRQQPDIIHVHDPELLPHLLRVRGPALVYDAHEDLGASVAYKHYVPAALRPLVAAASELAEHAMIPRLSGVVAATPHIGERLATLGVRTVVVQNFPRLDEFGRAERSATADDGRRLAYVGGISERRGARVMLDLLGMLRGDVTLDLAGECSPAALRADLERHPAWGRVRDHGFIDRAAVANLLADATVGLLLLLPERNYVNAYPTKLFEYMAMGVPVVASDFPLWRSIVETAGCGLLVDPEDPAAGAAAVQRLLDDPALARSMGERGRRMVVERFNWQQESLKLLRFYDDLLANVRDGRRGPIGVPA